MRRGDELRLYAELAEWWPLLSPPGDYVDEIADLRAFLDAASDAPPRAVLELGSGGGSVAHHLCARYRMTLVDRSEAMLAQSRRVNPSCEHVCGDMRSLRLSRAFDAVLIHDAVMYATDEEDLRATLATARAHVRPGGGIVILPDFVRETFEPGTSTGGHDDPDGRGLRFLEWIWDPDPTDTTYDAAWALLLREADGRLRVESDHHRLGLFPREAWLRLLAEAGFDARAAVDSHRAIAFLGRKRP